MSEALPKDWKWVKLGEVCDKISLNKIKIKQKDYLKEGIFPVIDQGQELIGGYYNNENLVIPNEPPYVIFGDHTKVKKFINFKFIAGADGVKVLKAKDVIDSKFLFYSLYTIKIEDKGYARHFQLLEKELFPLPPKATQQAIVSKIEELFSEIEKGIESLSTAQQQLKTYRQSVLKWAFEGKLTETSTEWNYKTFKVCLKFSQGIQVDVNLQSLKQNKGYVRFLRIIDFTQGKDEHRFIENPGDRYFINKDEVALVRYGATTGFVCSGKEGVIANNLFKVTPIDKILNRYLFHFLNSTFFQNVIAQNIKGAAMPAISFGLINDVMLPFPSIKEQNNIVQEIETRLSVADKMEESINESLQQAEALKQSILKKAFEGKLI